MKFKIFLMILISVFLLGGSSNLPYSNDNINNLFFSLSTENKEKLDDFFTAFTQSGLDNFEEQQLNDYILISFGVRYNEINNPNLFIKSKDNENYVMIDKKYVNKTVQKYFNKNINKDQSLEEYLTYNEGFYSIPYSLSSGTSFSKVTKLLDNKDGTFTSYVDNYVTIEDTNKPILVNSIKSKISLLNENGENRYILLNYLSQ